MGNVEEWKDVIGYENLFMISNFGVLYSKRTNKILKQTISKTGYYTCATKIGGRKGKNLCFKIHRLVALAFIPNPENKQKVNHIDGNKLNNNVSNLEWVTPQENSIHAVSLGLLKPPKGFDHPSFKLTFEEVCFIKENYVPGNSMFGGTALSRKFNVSLKTIYRAFKMKLD